jgi:integrase
MFADSWLRSKQPPMSKPSYCMTLERAWKNHVAPVWADQRSGRSGALRFRIGCPTSRREVEHRRHPRSAFSPASSTSPSMTVASRTIRPATSATSSERAGKRRVYLSHDQVATLAACSGHPTMVLTLAYTGLRWGEATALRVRSVNRLRDASSSKRTR